MNERTDMQPAPLCPHCGTQLLRKGKVVDCGNYKKWVEDWQCPVHGVIPAPKAPVQLTGPAPAEPAA